MVRSTICYKSGYFKLQLFFLLLAACCLFLACGNLTGDLEDLRPRAEYPVPVITINTQPAPTTNVTEGSISGSLEVAAGVTYGATLSYQWYSNTNPHNSGGIAIYGAVGSAFPIPAALTGGIYFYYCIVGASGGAAAVHSSVAMVNVTAQGITPAPIAFVTDVGKTALVQKEVLFTLASTHTGTNTWRVYNDETGGSPLATVSAVYDAPNLTLTATGADLAVGAYHVSVQQDGLAESSRLELTVTAQGVSTAPTTLMNEVAKAAPVQKAVVFALTSAHTNTDTWRVYDAATDGSELTGVSVTASYTALNLTLTASGADLAAGTYYVSVQNDGLAESSRLELTVIGRTEAPTADVTSVAKDNPVQKEVVFALTSAHTGVNTWRVYSAGTGGTELETVTATFAGTNLTLTASGTDLAAGPYYVSVEQSGMAESFRIELIVIGRAEAPTAAVTSVAKDTPVQKAVVFELTGAHTGTNTWRVYDAATGGSELTGVAVTASYTAPNLTLTATGADLAAGPYYISVQQAGMAESSRLELTVIGRTATPTAVLTSISKTVPVQKAVVFELTSMHIGLNTWRVYDAATGGSELTGVAVTASYTAPNLTLTATGVDLAASMYYVSVEQDGMAESSRLALTVFYFVEMVFVPGGSFELGRNLGTGGGSDVTPVSTVTLTGFYMGKYPVTQDQYEAVIGTNPSYFHGRGVREPAAGENQGRRPVERVSWYDAIEFCNKLSEREGLTPYYNIDKEQEDPNNLSGADPYKWLITFNTAANGYRLPTEAQWEYAAKGGNGTPGNFTYAGSDTADDVAWYDGNSGGRTHEVGIKAPNGLDIYDMSGNVWEWCWDWYGTYNSGTDPTGASSGASRVHRGGGWNGGDGYARSVRRYISFLQFNRYDVLGLRLVLP